MSAITSLEPQAVWKFFDLICSVPHPSGYENALAQRLASAAEAAGLSVRQDVHLRGLCTSLCILV